MGLFSKKDNGLMNVIRCDRSDYLVWKWHPADSVPGRNSRENSIRWGSVLTVKEGEVAVFLCRQKERYIREFILGPYSDKLETKNLPVISSVYEKLYGSNTPFPAEVYYINLGEIIQVKFGVPFFDVFDPRYEEYPIPVAVRGTITFKIHDYISFVEKYRLETFDLNSFNLMIRDLVVKETKGIVTNYPIESNTPVLQIERRIVQISELLQEKLEYKLNKDFCVELKALDISAIEIDKQSEGYRQLKIVTQDIATSESVAQSQIRIKNMSDMQEINAIDIAEKMRMAREGYQSVDVVMPTVPPPPPPVIEKKPEYFVAKDGSTVGPYSIDVLTQMANELKIAPDTPIWKEGMANWGRASDIEGLFKVTGMPEIPD